MSQEVRKLPSVSLFVALQRLRQRGLEERRGFEESLRERLVDFIANSYFLAFLAWELLWAGFILQNPSPRTGGFYQFTTPLLFLWLYVGFLKNRLRRNGIVRLLALPFANFLKLIPFVGSWHLWVKWLIFCLMIGITSPWSGSFFGIFFDPSTINEDDLMVFCIFHLLPLALFSVTSAAYLKFCVLRVNVIQRLILLHPEGRRTAIEEL